jgi:hypothetical protein
MTIQGRTCLPLGTFSWLVMGMFAHPAELPATGVT